MTVADDFTMELPEVLYVPYFEERGSHVYHTRDIGDCFRLYDQPLTDHINHTYVSLEVLRDILSEDQFEEISRKMQK